MVVEKNVSDNDFIAMGDSNEEKNDKAIAPINLDGKVFRDLVTYCGKTRKKRAVVNEVMRWFLGLNPNLQRVIMDETDGLEDFLLELLRGMIHDIEAKKHDPHAVRELKAKRARNNE